MASSSFLLILSEGSSPNGSSPDFFRGLRQRSKILRNAPLLARSPRKPSSSLSSILKLSTSTDGRRVAPCRPMPEVVSVSSAMLPLPAGGRRDNGDGTRWFHGHLAAADRGPAGAENPPNPCFLAGFGACLP